MVVTKKLSAFEIFLRAGHIKKKMSYAPAVPIRDFFTRGLSLSHPYREWRYRIDRQTDAGAIEERRRVMRDAIADQAKNTPIYLLRTSTSLASLLEQQREKETSELAERTEAFPWQRLL